MRLDIETIGLGVWSLAVGGLGFAVGEHLEWGSRWHAEVPAPRVLASEPVVLNLPGVAVVPNLEKQYGQTLQRPLFVPTRRPAPPIPPPPPPPPPPKPTMQKGQFQLMGVIILSESSIAFLRENTGGKTHRVKKGQSINGLLVKDVTRDSVELAQYDDTEMLVVKIQPSPKQEASPKQEPPAAAQDRPPRVQPPPRVGRQGAGEAETAKQPATEPQAQKGQLRWGR